MVPERECGDSNSLVDEYDHSDGADCRNYEKSCSEIDSDDGILYALHKSNSSDNQIKRRSGRLRKKIKIESFFIYI